jgi:DHA1 family bicyclomycin/chloramphenicol resistance-like MFS transporter
LVGSAAGLYGFTQMAIGALCTFLVGFGSNPSLSAAIVLTAAAVCGQLGFWLARGSGRRGGKDATGMAG